MAAVAAGHRPSDSHGQPEGGKRPQNNNNAKLLLVRAGTEHPNDMGDDTKVGIQMLKIALFTFQLVGFESTSLLR